MYCPLGTAHPRVAQPGDLTIGGDERTRTGVARCPSSRYCVNGTALSCPAGRFGCATGLGSPECNGPCAPGFYCPEASDSNKYRACGNASVYCPEGSGAPRLVDEGHFSAGGPQGSQHSRQEPCPLGSYCFGGVRVSRVMRRCRRPSCCRSFIPPARLCVVCIVAEPLPSRTVRECVAINLGRLLWSMRGWVRVRSWQLVAVCAAVSIWLQLYWRRHVPVPTRLVQHWWGFVLHTLSCGSIQRSFRGDVV